MTFSRKRFGQHFLEPVWAAKVAEAARPTPRDVFVEIGPGHGVLTRPLAAAAAHVIAVEIDRDLVRELAAVAPPNVTVISRDFLELTAEDLLSELRRRKLDGVSLRVAGNL